MREEKKRKPRGGGGANTTASQPAGELLSDSSTPVTTIFPFLKSSKNAKIIMCRRKATCTHFPLKHVQEVLTYKKHS